MISPTFAKVATVQASTKRPPVIVDGKAGDPVTNIASLYCTRPVPVPGGNSYELQKTLKMETLVNILLCYVQDNLDIVTGDTLVIASGVWAGTYPIKLVRKHGFGNDVRKELVIEALKR